jgi:hypothetical protein
MAQLAMENIFRKKKLQFWVHANKFKFKLIFISKRKFL